MVSNELFEYIKSEKLNGVLDDDIKTTLLENNWEEKDIDEVLTKINKLNPDTPFEVNVKDRDKVFVVDDTRINPALEVRREVRIPIGNKVKTMPTIISVLFVVISFLFIYKAGFMITIMSIVNYFSHTTGAIYYFLNEFPLYGWVVVSLALSASIFLYGSFKVKSGTRFSFWFGVIILITLPISLSYINYKLMYSVSEYFSSDAIILNQNAPKIPQGTSTLVVGVLGEPAFFFPLATLLVLLISYKKFNFPNQKLSFKNLKLLILLVLLFTVPTALVVMSGYKKAKTDDFQFKFVSDRVDFHVYKPNPIPLGMVYVTNFIDGKDLAGRNDAIQVTYDYAFEQVPEAMSSRPVVLKQVEVPKNFSISQYLLTESGTYSIQKTMQLDNSVDKNAYLIENRLPNGVSSKNLVFLTPDNVLISISTVESSEYDLLDIAKSLQ